MNKIVFIERACKRNFKWPPPHLGIAYLSHNGTVYNSIKVMRSNHNWKYSILSKNIMDNSFFSDKQWFKGEHCEKGYTAYTAIVNTSNEKGYTAYTAIVNTSKENGYTVYYNFKYV